MLQIPVPPLISPYTADHVRKFYFSDIDRPLDKLPGEIDDYELAYAITVHKSQGSEFNHVFVVIPNKRALLSRELVYTALTRSTEQVTLFLQDDSGVSIRQAVQRSDILPRQTSIFSLPEDHRKMYEPEQGTFVRSRVEWILFKELKDREINFEYEKPHYFDKSSKTRRPDFTITVHNKEYFWEHLGMLDRQDYVECWNKRRELYEQNGLIDRLITTEDRNGISEQKINMVISDIINQTLAKTDESMFSLHHYELS